MTTSNQRETESTDMQKVPMVKVENDLMATQPTKKKSNTFLLYGFLIILGIGSGLLLHKTLNKNAGTGTNVATIKDEKSEGVTDVSTFKDQAEGLVEAGGVDDEGTHKLLREGGPSQTVALVSSVLDLDSYLGKKVKVWGQTFPPQKAGWFMDVGKIELLE